METQSSRLRQGFGEQSKLKTQNFGVPMDRRDNYFYIKLGIFILLLAWLAFLVAGKIDLITADLGRHIKNGEWVVENNFNLKNPNSPVHENFYSYTKADFPTVNHHWGAGVIFYELYKAVGFSGLSIFYIALSLLTFAIFFYIAKRESSFTAAVILSAFLLPLIAERREIRPEIFSCFFGAIFFWALWSWWKNELATSRLYILPFLMVFWVNLHVYFFLGIFLIGVFWISEIAQIIFAKLSDDEFSEKIRGVKNLTAVGIVSALAALANPFGWKGLVYPLEIFRNYGYTIVENKSVSFVENYGIANPNFFLVKAILISLVASYVLLFAVDRKKIIITAHYLALAVFFGVMGWLAIRNFTMLGLFALPVLAANIGEVFTPNLKENSAAKENGIAAIYILLLIVAAYANFQYVSYHSSNSGVGLAPGEESTADFLKNEKISGPIFNDYDIGSYLIFNLPDSEKVFVDNRPEAYPDSFFSEVYKPMQDSPDVFSEVDGKYNFNAIVFYLHDITPWGQNFLKNIQENEQWAPVYKDDYAIIYLKNNDTNEEIISKYKI